MTKDPNRPKSESTVNICKVCKTLCSLEEVKKRNMSYCGESLEEIEKDISVPLGP